MLKEDELELEVGIIKWVSVGNVMAYQQRNDGSKSRMGRIGYRPYWVLAMSIFIRALHQVGAAVFLAMILLYDEPDIPLGYTLLAVISGVALVFTEWLRHRQMYREVSGMGTVMKLVLMGLAMHGFFPQKTTFLAAFLLASICAHAPKNFRHRLLI